MKNVKPLCLIFLFAFIVFLNQSLFSQDNSEEFLKSIMQGEIKEVENYIDMGVDVNLVYKNRTTPLMFAIWGDHFDIVKLLIPPFTI